MANKINEREKTWAVSQLFLSQWRRRWGRQSRATVQHLCICTVLRCHPATVNIDLCFIKAKQHPEWLQWTQSTTGTETWPRFSLLHLAKRHKRDEVKKLVVHSQWSTLCDDTVVFTWWSLTTKTSSLHLFSAEQWDFFFYCKKKLHDSKRDAGGITGLDETIRTKRK